MADFGDGITQDDGVSVELNEAPKCYWCGHYKNTDEELCSNCYRFPPSDEAVRELEDHERQKKENK